MVCASARKYSPLRSASAKLVPSTEMPKPENIRRIVTGPKSENKWSRKSRSMALAQPARPCADASIGLAIHLRSRELDGLAAAASTGLVRVVEDELRRHLVDLVIHLGAQQKQHRLGIDQDLHALVLDHLVSGLDVVRIFDGIGLTRAAAILDPDAQADDLGIRAPGQLGDPLRGGFRQLHHLRSGARLRL